MYPALRLLTLGKDVGLPPLEGLLARLQAGTIWAKLDAFYVFRGAATVDAAKVNLKNPGTYDITFTGAPFFSTADGITVDGVDDVLDTNFNPSTAVGAHFGRNDASFGYWTDVPGQMLAAGTPMGGFNTNGNVLMGRNSSNGFTFRINQTASSSLAGITDHSGLSAADRSDGNTTRALKNGVALTVTSNANQASTALLNTTIKLGTSSGSTFACFTPTCAFIGGSLTADQHAELYAALAEYFAALTFAGKLTDAAYSWWSDPEFVQYDGKTLGVAMRGASTDQAVFQIDNTSKVMGDYKVVGSDFIKDDHSSGAIALDSDNRLISARAGHNEGTNVKIRRSTDATPANLGEEVLGATMEEGPSYPQIHVHGDNIWITNRTGTGINRDWDVQVSIAGGAWTRKKRMLGAATSLGAGTQNLYMLGGQPTADTKRLFSIGHPTNAQNPIRVMHWNMATGDVSDDSGVLGNVEDGTNSTAIADFADLPILRTPASGHSQRLLKVNDEGTMLLVDDFVLADNTGAVLLLGIFTGADPHNAADWTWKTVDDALGLPFYSTGHYAHGADFARETHTGYRIYRAKRITATGLSVFERLDSPDGDTWTPTLVKQWRGFILRPTCPIDASADLPVVWQQTKIYTDFENWDSDLFWSAA